MANRYAILAPFTWDNANTANWSTTSGGAGGASAPTTSDTAIFDSNSGAGTVSVDATATAGNVTINQSTITVQLAANVTLASLSVVTLTTGTLDLNGFNLAAGYLNTENANARGITSGAGAFNLSGNNGVVVSATALGNMTLDTAPTFSLTYSGGTGTRTYRWGSTSGGVEAKAAHVNVTGGTDTVVLQSGGVIGNLNFTGFAGSWTNATLFMFGDLTTSAGMTVGAGASVLNLVTSSGTKTITSNGKTLDFPITVGPTTFGTPTATWSFTDALTQGSSRAFTFVNGTVQLKNGVTSTTGAFATSGANAKTLSSTLAGSQATLSQASGTVTAANLTIRDINAIGGATFNAPVTGGNLNGGNNSGWNFATISIPGFQSSGGIRSFASIGRI